MWCCKCQRDLSECICPDLEERLNSLGQGSGVVFRKCKKCGKHYERCRCEDPEWILAGDVPKEEKL
jgi:hypothetical protein